MIDIEMVRGSTVDLVESMGDDDAVAEAALVSTALDLEQYNELRIAGLIRRLMFDRHGSPFEMVVFKFLIDTPVFTQRQLMRYRIASWNEVSGRYTVMKPRFYTPPEGRPMKRVEGSKKMDYDVVSDEEMHLEVQRSDLKVAMMAWQEYTDRLERGVVEEVARWVLPLNLMTQSILTINLRSLLNLLSQRGTGPSRFPSHPQYEIARVAEQMEHHVSEIVPVTWQAFVDNGRVAP